MPSLPGSFCISRMSTPAQKPSPGRGEDHDPHVEVAFVAVENLGETVGVADVQRVDFGIVHDELGDAIAVDRFVNGHACS